MKMFEKIWKRSKVPKELPSMCFGWHHSLVKVKNEIRHGAFVNIYHMHPGSTNYYLNPLWAFSDETIYLELQWGEKCQTMERLLELLENKMVVAFPPNNTQVVEIMRVVYRVTDIDSRVSEDDLILEIKDIWKQLRNEPDSLTSSRLAVRQYCDNPTQENLLLLKEIYFSMPRQKCPALINMDTKDHLVKNLFNSQSEKDLLLATERLTEEINYSWGKGSF